MEALLKNKLIALLLLVGLLITLPSFAANVNVTLPQDKITLNGYVYDSTYSLYPMLNYQGITYVPMTWQMATSLGLKTQYTDSEGLIIEKGIPQGDIQNPTIPQAHSAYNMSATIVAYPVTINGISINNPKETYPLLNYKNITYFPLTYRYATTFFGWSYAYTPATGLVVNASNANNTTPTLTQSIKAQPTYRSETIDINGKTKTAYITEITSLKDYEIDVVFGQDNIGQTETLESIAKRHNALVAINGTYFQAYDNTLPKEPYYPIIKSGEVLHLGANGTTVGFTSENAMVMDKLTLTVSGTTDNKSDWLHSWYVYWINHTPVPNQNSVVIFTNEHGSYTDFPHGLSIVAENNKIIDIVSNQNTPIPQNGFVVNLQGVEINSLKNRFTIGDAINYSVDIETNNNDWSDVTTAVGSGPRLLTSGAITVDPHGEGFTEDKILSLSGTRSIIGQKRNGALVLMVLRNVTIQEAAEISLKLGLSDAMCLDGGASSGLYVNGKTVWQPGRELSNILIFK